jgi:hypothetical protein
MDSINKKDKTLLGKERRQDFRLPLFPPVEGTAQIKSIDDQPTPVDKDFPLTILDVSAGGLKCDSTAKTGCLTPMGVFNSKNCLEQIAQKVLFQLKIANLDLHYYGFVFVNLNLGIISLLLAFSASLACPEPSGKTA